MHKGLGFTLLEVMIFVAVSGFIFVFAVGSITSQQRRVQFSQSTREFESKILDIINDVSTGYYPMNDLIGCSAGGAGQRPTLSSAGGTEMGTNSACLNIGKAMQLRPVVDTTQQESNFYVYNLIGRRYAGDADDGVTVKNLADAKPLAATLNTINDAVEYAELRYGLKVTRVYSGSDLSNVREYGTIAFVSNFEGSPVGNSPASSQGQTIRVGGIVDTSTDPADHTKDEAVSIVINNLTDDNSLQGTTGYFEMYDPTTGIVICLEDMYERKASLQIGKNGKASTELKVDDYELGCD